MSQILLAFGGTILFVLGALHGILTLRDLWTSRSFTPTDDAVRLAMQGAQLAFNPRANLWRAWLGFNLSHSLGLVLFGGGLVLLAWLHFSAFAASHLLQGSPLVSLRCTWRSRFGSGSGRRLSGLVFHSSAYWAHWCLREGRTEQAVLVLSESENAAQIINAAGINL